MYYIKHMRQLLLNPMVLNAMFCGEKVPSGQWSFPIKFWKLVKNIYDFIAIFYVVLVRVRIHNIDGH